MGDVVPLRRRTRRRDRARGRTLCRHGFHDWAPDPERPFEVREGRLVNLERCRRCGATRSSLT